MDVNEFPRVKALRETIAELGSEVGRDVWHEVKDVCEAVVDELATAAKLVVEGNGVREQMMQLLELIAVTVWGPKKPGEQYDFGKLADAIASLKERVPSEADIVIADRVNGHDLQKAAEGQKGRRELAQLRQACAQLGRRGAMLEEGIRKACAQRDAYGAQLEAEKTTAAQLKSSASVAENIMKAHNDLLVRTVLALRGLDEHPGSLLLEDAPRMAGNFRGCLEATKRMLAATEHPSLVPMAEEIGMVLDDQVPNAQDAAQEGAAP